MKTQKIIFQYMSTSKCMFLPAATKEFVRNELLHKKFGNAKVAILQDTVTL